MSNPTHLTCPWCPAQAFLKSKQRVLKITKGMTLLEYVCPAKHSFYIESKEDE